MKFAAKYIYLLLFILTSICHTGKVYAQHGRYDTIRVHGYITAQGDTIPFYYLPPVTVTTYLTHKDRKRIVEWTRLRNAVYVTYPYAKTAGRVINEINARLVNVTDRKKRRLIIHSREKELKRDFADKVTALSIYQGKVLMKLIYRETGNNCYEIIDEYKGTFSAAFWQTIALMFGGNLRQNYDPANADKDMEKIVKEVARMYGYRT